MEKKKDTNEKEKLWQWFKNKKYAIGLFFALALPVSMNAQINYQDNPKNRIEVADYTKILNTPIDKILQEYPEEQANILLKQWMLQVINKKRKEAGKDNLKFHPKAEAWAILQAHNIAKWQCSWHDGIFTRDDILDGSGLVLTWENIWAQMKWRNIKELVDKRLMSNSHQWTIMSQDAKYIGICFVLWKDGKAYAVIWTLEPKEQVFERK